MAISGVTHWDGTISTSQFQGGARDFADKWKLVNHGFPDWTWVSCRRTSSFIHPHEVDGYLSLENWCLFQSDKICHVEVGGAGKEAVNSLENGVSADSATLVQVHGLDVHYYDFHILYNSSYRVPMMYFRGYRYDGQPLQLDDIEKDLPVSSAKVLTESKWTFITQQEHPYLNRPWYTLHPCGTSEVMRLLFQNYELLGKDEVAGDRYLLSWLSVIGQVVGLKVPHKLLKDVKPIHCDPSSPSGETPVSG
ncbi:E2-like conjugating enzyme atg10 [Dionaea muscipula]